MNIEIFITLAEWCGAISGIIGSFLLAANKPYSGYGWVAFLISNICIIVFAISHSHWGVLLMQTTFMASTILGLIRWFEWTGTGFSLKAVNSTS